MHDALERLLEVERRPVGPRDRHRVRVEEPEVLAGRLAGPQVPGLVDAALLHVVPVIVSGLGDAGPLLVEPLVDPLVVLPLGLRPVGDDDVLADDAGVRPALAQLLLERLKRPDQVVRLAPLGDDDAQEHSAMIGVSG